MPKRTSLPSMLPPVEPSIAPVWMPAACWAGVPCSSAMYTTTTLAIKSIDMAEKIAHPCRRLPTMRP